MPALEPHEHLLPAPPTQKALPASAGSSGSLMRKLALVLLMLAAAAFAWWKIKGNKQEAADTAAKTSAMANRAIPVTVAPVTSKTMPIFLSALGTVTAYNTVTVKSRVDGQLLSVNVREGQQVRRGQVLAMIDPRPYEAAVAQAQGVLTKDQATAENARAQAGRYTALYQAGVVSKESEQAQLTSANVSVGTLEADRAAIQAAKVNVAYTRITSPIDGVVGLRQVDAGNIIHASDANGLLVVTQLQPIAVIFTMPEDQLPAVMAQMRIGKKLVVDAYDRSESRKLATGTLLTLDNQIDTTTGTVKAKAIFDNRDGALFPNQFVNVRLILEQRQNSLVMPASALQSGVNGTFVYVVKPGTPPKRANDEEEGTNTAALGGKGAGKGGPKPSGAPSSEPAGPPRDPYYVDVQNIVVDLTEGSQIILKSGVKAGDQVVVDGQEKLRRFSKVDPRQAGATTRGPAAGTAQDRTSAGPVGTAGGPSTATPPGTEANPGTHPQAPTQPGTGQHKRANAGPPAGNTP